MGTANSGKLKWKENPEIPFPGPHVSPRYLHIFHSHDPSPSPTSTPHTQYIDGATT